MPIHEIKRLYKWRQKLLNQELKDTIFHKSYGEKRRVFFRPDKIKKKTKQKSNTLILNIFNV